jgi:hypothetical protein
MPIYKSLQIANGADRKKVNISIAEFLGGCGEFGFPATARVLDLGTSGANGLDTGSMAPDTWYDCFWMWDNEASLLDTIGCIMDNTPSLPTDYDQYERIGSVRTDGTAAPNCQLYRFTRTDDLWEWMDATSSGMWLVCNQAASTTWVTKNARAPVPSASRAFYGRMGQYGAAAGLHFVQVRATGSTRNLVTLDMQTVTRIMAEMRVPVDASGQFDIQTYQASGSMWVQVHGYWYPTA